MSVERHPELRVQRVKIGREQAPLLVVDNLVAQPDALVELAASKMFSGAVSYYPGMRAKAPLSYQQFILEGLRPFIDETFGSAGQQLRFTECNFCVLTTPPEQLSYLQRLPHVDSLDGDELAMIHYLFRADFGGTSFYRHRDTGFEFVDKARQASYMARVAVEKAGPDAAPAQYINGDTPLYERVEAQAGVFNRLLMYRRTSLHSASIAPGFISNPDPRKGRLSINGFLA
jgi:hypothetical protein